MNRIFIYINVNLLTVSKHVSLFIFYLTISSYTDTEGTLGIPNIFAILLFKTCDFAPRKLTANAFFLKYRKDF